MLYSTDDVSTENLKYFKFWDLVKASHPRLELIAFVIAKDLDLKAFGDWYEERKDWVEVGVHCYDHGRPQEGWREDQEDEIKKALEILGPFLKERFLYRPPGFRFLPKTELILKRLGFGGIAHQEFVKYFDTGQRIQIFNTHCTLDQYEKPIGLIWKSLITRMEFGNGQYHHRRQRSQRFDESLSR